MRVTNAIKVATMFLALTAASAAAGSVISAHGQWAAIDRGPHCEAVSRALRAAKDGQPQAVAGFAFDVRGPRHGQFFARLSRNSRAGSSVMLTIAGRPFLLVSRGGWAWSSGPRQEAAIIAEARAAGGMRVQGRDDTGRRFTDRYLLNGSATAIDAAAAACAGKRAQR